MRRFLTILVVIISAFIGAVSGVVLTLRYVDSMPAYNSIENRQNLMLTRMGLDSSKKISAGPNFAYAARMITPAVVHIIAVYGPGDFSLNPLELGYRQQARSSGSGVIISDDGYIVTNFHVIEDATNLEVVMSDNERFYAKVIGRDPDTDLAEKPAEDQARIVAPDRNCLATTSDCSQFTRCDLAHKEQRWTPKS